MSVCIATEEIAKSSLFLKEGQLLKVLGQLTYRRRHIRNFLVLFRLVQRLLQLVRQGACIHREVLEEELQRQGIILQDL